MPKSFAPVNGHKSQTALLWALLLAASAPLPARASDTKSSTTLKFSQISRILGDEEVIVSADGIRIENRRAGVVTIARKPDWIVYQFSAVNKRYTAAPLQDFHLTFNTAQCLAGGIELHTATMTKTADSQFLGIDSQVWREDAAFTAKALKMFLVDKTVRGNFPKSLKYTISAPKSFPPEAAHVLCVLYGLPDRKGIPLDMYCNSIENHSYKMVTTKSVSPATLNPTDLELPAGYTKVVNESRLTTDSATESAILDMLGSHAEH